MGGAVGVVLLLCGVSAAYLSYHEHSGVLRNTDAYAYFLPNILYAARAVQEGGQGLLWNPYQACGVPFLANPQVGFFYPPHWLFFVLDPDVALRTVLVLDMAIAGLGAYLFCLEIGLGPVAALAGALLVGVGPTGAGLAKWSPIHVGPWAWLPVAMFCTERLLRWPSGKRAIALGAALTMALLPGFPQIVLFTYELVVLRMLWQFLIDPASRRPALIAYVAIAAALPFAFGAIQLVPTLELVHQSVRGRDLPANEIREGARKVLAGVVAHVKGRAIMGAPADIVALLLAPLALLRSPAVSAARFYAIVYLLAWGLRLGPGTPLYDLYARLPSAGIFQYPSRFIWVADYAVAILAAIGLANVGRFLAGLSVGSRRIGAGIVAVATALLLAAAWSFGWLPFEPFVLIPATIALLAALFRGRNVPALAAAVLLLLAIEVFLRPPGPLHSLGPADQYRSRAASLGIAQQLVSPMDRVLILHRRGFHVTQDLILKTAMLFRLHGVGDYEAIPTRQFADIFSMMMLGRLPTGVFDVQNTTSSPAIANDTSRRLLNLLATRLVLSDPTRSEEVAILNPPLLRRLDAPDLQIDENAEAFPRAFVVPTVVVEPDRHKLLQRLSNGPDDLRNVALLDAPFADGFTGSAGGVPSNAMIVVDEPERVTIQVNSITRAFLILTDQWYPGWRATVNGVAAPIQRANHAFRAVQIPEGPALVEFGFYPTSLWVGAVVSLCSLVIVAVVCLRSRA